MRHSATRALFERDDVIIVASVSCIYGIGSPEVYAKMTLTLKRGQRVERQRLLRALVELQYRRNDLALHPRLVPGRAATRSRSSRPTSRTAPGGCRCSATRSRSIVEFDPLTGERNGRIDQIRLYPNSHYVTPKPTLQQAVEAIKVELKERLEFYRSTGKLLEAERIEQRTVADLEMILTTGSCPGIENYSRYLDRPQAGRAAADAVRVHPAERAAVRRREPRRGAAGGRHVQGRLAAQVDAGRVRLPPALLHRQPPAQVRGVGRDAAADDLRLGHARAPGSWSATGGVFVEQVIRPTGLVDPEVIVRPVEHQVDDLMAECRECATKGLRVLVTTLTKRMAEDLSEYLHENGVRVRYLHSDIDTLERIEIVRDLRLGKFDVLVGINLLREGLDIPECGLVAILDADKEGYLRSETSLIQTIGRAARNVDGRVILYADTMTGASRPRIDETERRRAEAGGLERGARHHAAEHQEEHRRHHAARWPSATTSRSTSTPAAPRRSPGSTCRPISASSRSGCGRPPPTSSSRRRRGCATRSSGWRTASWASRAPARPAGPPCRRCRLEAPGRQPCRQAPGGAGEVPGAAAVRSLDQPHATMTWSGRASAKAASRLGSGG